MSSPYGDFYPLGERLPHPDTYPAVQEVGRLAMESAMAIAAETPMNLSAAELHMRAFAGLFNGPGSVDEQTFNRMTDDAKGAAVSTAETCYNYFDTIGQLENVHDEIDMVSPDGGSPRELGRVLLNRMQIHTSIAARQEYERQRGAMYRGFNPGGRDWPGLQLPLESATAAEVERLSLDPPYSMEGIRDVVRSFGLNLGPFIEDFHANAPLGVDRRTIVHHAHGSLQSALPTDR